MSTRSDRAETIQIIILGGALLGVGLLLCLMLFCSPRVRVSRCVLCDADAMYQANFSGHWVMLCPEHARVLVQDKLEKLTNKQEEHDGGYADRH